MKRNLTVRGSTARSAQKGSSVGRGVVLSRQSSVQVLDRLMQILSVFGRDSVENHGLSLRDICQRVPLDKGTIHRLVKSATVHGWIEQDEDTRKYWLGLRLFDLGMVAVMRLGIGRAAHELLVELARATGETVNLAVLSDGEVLCLDKAESDRPFRFPSQVGLRLPVHCTSAGKVLLSALPEEDFYAVLRQRTLRRFTSHTICDTAKLRSDLALVRRWGYALDDEELEIGLRCVSAPVSDHSGKLIAALSVAGPAARFPKTEILHRVAILKDVAGRVSQRLGYRSSLGGDAKTVPSARRGLHRPLS